MAEHMFSINWYAMVVIFRQMDALNKTLTMVVQIGLPTLTPADTRLKDSNDTREGNRKLAVGTMSETTQPASVSAQSGQCQTSCCVPVDRA